MSFFFSFSFILVLNYVYLFICVLPQSRALYTPGGFLYSMPARHTHTVKIESNICNSTYRSTSCDTTSPFHKFFPYPLSPLLFRTGPPPRYMQLNNCNVKLGLDLLRQHGVYLLQVGVYAMHSSFVQNTINLADITLCQPNSTLCLKRS